MLDPIFADSFSNNLFNKMVDTRNTRPIKNIIWNRLSFENQAIEYPTMVANIASPRAHHIIKFAPWDEDIYML
jgi:hypothetical protein